MSNWEEVYKNAKTQFEVGNYNKARYKFEELLKIYKNDLPIKEKSFVKDYINKTANFREVIIPNKPGEALFPAIETNNNLDACFTLKIVERGEDPATNILAKNWDIVKQNVASFLSKKLNQSDFYCIVFDWNFDDLDITLKTVIANSYSISGNSMQLAMGVALLSYILDSKVPSNFAFSGTLEEEKNGMLSIGVVEGIERKKTVLADEKNITEHFYYSSGITDFDELLQKIFGKDYLKEIVDNYVVEKANSVSVIKKSVPSSIPDEKISLLKFCINGSYPIEKLNELNFLFSKIQESEIWSSIIVDNLRPTFAVGMLTPKFVNKIKGFVSISYPGGIVPDDMNSTFDSTAIVVYKTTAYARVKEGEIIYY